MDSAIYGLVTFFNSYNKYNKNNKVKINTCEVEDIHISRTYDLITTRTYDQNVICHLGHGRLDLPPGKFYEGY